MRGMLVSAAQRILIRRPKIRLCRVASMLIAGLRYGACRRPRGSTRSLFVFAYRPTIHPMPFRRAILAIVAALLCRAVPLAAQDTLSVSPVDLHGFLQVYYRTGDPLIK